jgi:sugar O-acyltransferase (sialic acid O-acetyltransferase NeuD family)
MIKSEIFVPLLNANEPEARVVTIHIKDRQSVEKGELLFTIETTKAATDIESPQSGYVVLTVKEGDTLTVGERLAVITETANENVERPERSEVTAHSSTDLRITKPARALAESLGVKLAELPKDKLVTEEIVRQFSGVTPEIKLKKSDKPYILIYGGGGHAKTVMEMITQLGEFSIAGIVDDNIQLTGTQVLGIPVVGSRSSLSMLTSQGVRLAANCVGGILDINIRVKVFELLEAEGFSFPALVHPTATIEQSSKISEGVQVFANSYIGADAVLKPRCMVNTTAVISHDCIIGSYTHIAPGALLAGHVHVGERTLIGMGVTTTIGINIGAGVRIGNAAIILADVPDKTIIQAGKTWVGKKDD